MRGELAVAVPILLVPLVAIAATVTVRRNRALRRRPGDVPVLVRTRWGGWWLPGHGVWVADVFAFRRSPAGWHETLLWVTNTYVRSATDEERTRIRRAGDDPVVAVFVLASGGSMTFAASAGSRARLLGPFAEPARNGAATAAR